MAIESLSADRAELLRTCSGLRPADWQAGSGCAGWTVQDVVSHLAALFWLVVEPGKLPDADGLPTERANDVYVRHRRSLSPADALADYEQVSAAALPALAGLADADFELALGDLGTHKAAAIPAAYSFDHYVHIRMDLFAPRGPLAGAAPPSDAMRLAPALDWVAAALPQQCAPALGDLPGSIVFVITGTGARTMRVGSGEPLGEVTVDSQTFIRAITQRSGWAGARIAASADELNPAVLGRLKVF